MKLFKFFKTKDLHKSFKFIEHEIGIIDRGVFKIFA